MSEQDFLISVLDHESQQKATVLLHVAVVPDVAGEPTAPFDDFTKRMTSHVNRFLKEYCPDGYRVLHVTRGE